MGSSSSSTSTHSTSASGGGSASPRVGFAKVDASTTSNINTTGTVQVTNLAAGINQRPPFWIADESSGSFWDNTGY